MGKEKCVAVFEFVTNEACKTKPGPEIPCSLYGTDKEIIDLTPLIKTEGNIILLMFVLFQLKNLVD